MLGTGLISLIALMPISSTSSEHDISEQQAVESPAPPSRDAFIKSEGAAVPSATQIRAAAAGDQTKTAAIDGMMARDTRLPQASAAEQRQLRADLSKVDAGVLEYAQSRGVKMQVVRPGDDLVDAKVIRQQDPKAIDQQLPQMAAFSKQLNRDVQKRFDEPMARLEAERQAYLKKKGLPDPATATPMLGATRSDAGLQDFDKRQFDLRQQKNEYLGKALGDSNLPLTDYHIPMSSIPDGGVAAQGLVLMSQQPVSTESMAVTHGFTTPQEKAQFNSWVEGINGERLAKARGEMLGNLADFVAKNPRDTNAKNLLAAAKAHPETIPVDHKRFNILVPDIHARREPKPGASPGSPPSQTGKPLFVDEHDLSTLRDWYGPEGRRIDKPFDEKTGEGTPLEGQFFGKGDLNRIVVMNTNLGDGVPTHELGHAIDNLVKKEDPAFYAPWQHRLDVAYKAADNGHEKQISEYSRTNTREYLAEGFRGYYHDPKLLKTKDPELFALVKELTQRASDLAAKQAR